MLSRALVNERRWQSQVKDLSLRGVGHPQVNGSDGSSQNQTFVLCCCEADFTTYIVNKHCLNGHVSKLKCTSFTDRWTPSGWLLWIISKNIVASVELKPLIWKKKSNAAGEKPDTERTRYINDAAKESISTQTQGRAQTGPLQSNHSRPTYITVVCRAFSTHTVSQRAQIWPFDMNNYPPSMPTVWPLSGRIYLLSLFCTT